MFESKNVLYGEPREVIRARLEEQVNRARWTGQWGDIPEKLREKYDNVPEYLKSRFREILGSLEDSNAFPYQKFDATLAALRKTCMLTHNMGLGKTRISLLASQTVNKPTLVVALPRLIRTVWVKEMNLLGIEDWAILERPKRSKPVKIVKTDEDINDLKGLAGLGKLSLSKISRDDKTTSDASHPARVKIISYTMLLPGVQALDYVICPDCGMKHKEERCPKVYIKVHGIKQTDADRAFLDRLAFQYRKGLIDNARIKERVTERFGEDANFYTTYCRHSAKGSLCPVCRNRLGNRSNSGYHCAACGYSARTWMPPMARRLNKRIKMVVLDESQAVKNHQALRSRYALSLRPEYRYLTSGTPATADVAKDLYYQIAWLLGKGVMFPYTSLQSFQKSIRIDGSNNMGRLHSLLDPIQIRRDTDDYGVSEEVELPPVKERRFSIPMSDEEWDNYEQAERDIVAWLQSTREDVTELDLFSKMWILRRAACVPWVDNPSIQKSTKIEALKVEVNNYLAQGKKILIGTEMLAMLDAIVENIPGVEHIDGSVPIKTSDRIISLFQDVCPDCNIGLVEEFGKMICPLCEKEHKTPQVLAASRMAVREGVTLNRASVVIFTDPSWTYAEMWQFWKRAQCVLFLNNLRSNA